MPKHLRTYPIIAGPTAAGKTALAVHVAQAIGGEVVSADSMQIYAGVSIGTARPSKTEMQEIPHHLQGFLPLSEKYSVARYAADADTAFRTIFNRQHTPVLCGGTGLYIQSFMENRVFLPQPSDPVLRQKLKDEAMQEGGAAMLSRLATVDPVTAARLHPHDINRIVRALEVYTVTGKTITEQDQLSHAEPSPFDPCLFVLCFRDRSELYRRIDRRVDDMMQAGLLQEAKQVLCQDSHATVLQAIGYKEFLPYFAGEITLDDAVKMLKTETHHYAKRQISWFGRMADARPIYIDDYTDTAAIAKEILYRYNQFCKE